MSKIINAALRLQYMKAYGVITKGNGDVFLSEEYHTSLSLGGGQAGQGYPCVMVIYETDNSD